MQSKLITSYFYELGVHIGSSTNKVHPYMSQYTLGNRNGFSIIDVSVSFFYLKKACNFTRLLGRKNSNLFFFHSNLDKYSEKITLSLISLIYGAGHSFLDKKWSPGLLSNYHSQFSDIINFIIPEKISLSKINFKWLFLKILVYMLENKIQTVSWDDYIVTIRKFWKFFSFFKFYRVFNHLPDVFFYFNPSLNKAPVKECNYLKIPVVGSIDTDFNFLNITYPIPSNDDSLMICFFYYLLFIRSYKLGEVEKFKKITI